MGEFYLLVGSTGPRRYKKLQGKPRESAKTRGTLTPN
jgi:hypothetical protein